jgi:hypothetical protein
MAYIIHELFVIKQWLDEFGLVWKVFNSQVHYYCRDVSKISELERSKFNGRPCHSSGG